ncbi:MAG: hypothetical protein ACRD68_06605, partial [Pyrinomonadaceae bacterium]
EPKKFFDSELIKGPYLQAISIAPVKEYFQTYLVKVAMKRRKSPYLCGHEKTVHDVVRLFLN